MKKTQLSDNAVNFEALFLGPKGENEEFYKNLLIGALKDHCNWRREFHKFDTDPFISEKDKQRADFLACQNNIKAVLKKLSHRLKKNQPFFSPRYIGHMIWEIMAAPIVAFLATAFYNSNNVARDASTGTALLEIEVGKDLLILFGMDKKRGWAHICSGGTIANIEALWIARNMKVIPLVLKQMSKEFGLNDFEFTLDQKKICLSQMTDFELLSKFTPDEIIKIKEILIANFYQLRDKKEVDNLYDSLTMQEQGFFWGNLDNNKVLDVGLVFMPQTKHYSLKKAMDILGLGRKNIRYVPVTKDFRISITALKEMIYKEIDKHPILAVVAVAGTTEESAVDEIDKIIKLREEIKSKTGVGFHIHVDAAYGGYVRTIFLDENFNFMERNKLQRKLKELNIMNNTKRSSISWPSLDVYNAYKYMSLADTITVDPHKLGYVLYPAGGIVLRDKRMRDFIHCFAPYVFKKPKPGEPDTLIGSYILEGSKPGASVAAVWTAHRTLPLNITGYGKLIGETIEGAQKLWQALKNCKPFEVDSNIKIYVHPILRPDLNIINYIFNFKGNRNLEKTNILNEWMINKILKVRVKEELTDLQEDFIVSDTDFSFDEYGNSPVPFLKEIGIPESEWKRVKTLKVIRSVIMNPYLTQDYVDKNYVNDFIHFLAKNIKDNKDDILEIYNN